MQKRVESEDLVQMSKREIGILTIGLLAGLSVGLMIGYLIFPKTQQEGSHVEIERDSYKYTGDASQLTTPISYAVDRDWSTKVEWNTTHLGDFSVYIVEDFTVPSSAGNVDWEFKAYHMNTGSLIPSPMEVSYWNGSSWKQLYELDDQDHVNEVFVETLNIPAEASLDCKISIRTTIKYSSHVVGGTQHAPSQLWQYVEYFEGKMTMIRP